MERLAQAKGNMNESWKTVNQVLNKRSKSTNIDLLKGPGGEIVNKQEISNTMNDYFCSVGMDLHTYIHTYIHHFVDEQVSYWQLAADVYLLFNLLTINK